MDPILSMMARAVIMLTAKLPTKAIRVLTMTASQSCRNRDMRVTSLETFATGADK